MGMVRLAFVLGLVALASPARAGAKEETAVAACLAKTADGKGDAHRCIGVAADACLDRGKDPSNAGMVACYAGETEAWDARLNAYYRKVMGGLPPETARKLQDAERAWIEARKLSCEFFDAFYEGGTMAHPMIADCYNRATAERALYLKGFADEVGGR